MKKIPAPNPYISAERPISLFMVKAAKEMFTRSSWLTKYSTTMNGTSLRMTFVETASANSLRSGARTDP